MSDKIVGCRGVTEITISDNGYVSVYDKENNKPVSGFAVQEGAIYESGVNGVQIEDLILIAINRLEAANAKFACNENLITIDALKAALKSIEWRDHDRKERGVHGYSIA